MLGVDIQQEMLDLYKREKVNPAAGCLPIFLQIPVFYALYKVLTVSVEMRHQPFYLWIRDLSAPDPLTPVNLFGLLPFDPPGFLAIGILPILLGVTMWLQFRLNPAPMDAVPCTAARRGFSKTSTGGTTSSFTSTSTVTMARGLAPAIRPDGPASSRARCICLRRVRPRSS